MNKKIINLNVNLQRGFTLIELIFTLVISIVVIVGSISLYNRMVNVTRTAETVQEIKDGVRVVHALNQGVLTYSSINNLSIIKSQSFPAKYIVGANVGNPTDIVNPYKGRFIVGGSSLIGINGDNTLVIQLNGIPNNACVDLLTTDFGTLLLSKTLDSNSPIPGHAAISPDQASVLCTQGTSPHTISFEFY